MNALQALIAAHVEATGESYAAIARRGGMSRQTLSTLVGSAGLKQTPRPETLRRLAVGLGLNLNVVRAAAATAAGFDTINLVDQDALVIVAALGELNTEQRRALRARAVTLLQEARADALRSHNHNGIGATRRPARRRRLSKDDGKG